MADPTTTPTPTVRNRRANWGADLALLGITLVWGWTYALVKVGVAEVGPLTFLAFRFGIAFVLLAAIAAPRLRRAPGWVWRRGAVLGLALFAGYGFQTWGLVYTTATKSGFISGLSVVIVPLLVAGLLRERIGPSAWLGAGLATLGLGLLTLGPGAWRQAGVNVGDGLTLACALAFAVQIVLVGRLAREGERLPLLVIQIGVVALLSAVGWLTLEKGAWPQAGVAWEGILITAVLATVVAYGVQTRFQPRSTAPRAAIIYTGEPVFAGVFGVALLGEPMSGVQGLGAGLILGAMLVSQAPALRRRVRGLRPRLRRRPPP